MDIKLSEELINAVGKEKLAKFGFTLDNLKWNKFIEINLTTITIRQAKSLLEFCKPHENIRGTKVTIKDLETWIGACTDAGGQKSRKLEHFESLLIEYVAKLEGHRLFQKDDKDGNAWLCYYINNIKYHEEVQTSYGYTPAYVEMVCVYDKFGIRNVDTHDFKKEDINGRTVVEILARAGFYAETKEMREKYLKEIEKYTSIIPNIGEQYSCVGTGTDDTPDGNSHYRTTVFEFTDHEKRNRVVIDIFCEGERRREKDRGDRVDTWFWSREIEKINMRHTKAKMELKTERERHELPLEDVLDEEPPEIEIPTHPFLVVFDLQRHLRLAVHVNYLTKYVYDENLHEKLILPENVKKLISILIEHKEGSFKDIVAGKGGGAIILLTGAAGVGKTLTAEVFAESEKKPLYSVQASQLGTDPEELEKELMTVLTRAARWKAVMLIDECDVYVHERGNDLDQNAIVGVFLRVLEYHASILFLTTNRPDLVDDAIASRCVARIDYKYPSPTDQNKIWKVLAESSSIDLDEKVVEEFVTKHPKISGRDVKNLLKLSRLISMSTKKNIDLELIEYVMQFKPTVIKEE